MFFSCYPLELSRSLPIDLHFIILNKNFVHALICFTPTRSLHSNEVSNQIQNLCSAAGVVISVVIQFCFFFGKLCLFFSFKLHTF